MRYLALFPLILAARRLRARRARSARRRPRRNPADGHRDRPRRHPARRGAAAARRAVGRGERRRGEPPQPREDGKVTAALARLGVKPDDLQTRNLSLQRIDYGAERGRFRADNMVEVTLRDMDKVGEAVTAVTEAGANVMSGPDLRVSDREAASRSAYAAAYRAARSRAEAYAEAAGLKIERVLGIHDGGERAAFLPMDRVAPEAGGMATAQPPAAPPRRSARDQHQRGPGPCRFRARAK